MNDDTDDTELDSRIVTGEYPLDAHTRAEWQREIARWHESRHRIRELTIDAELARLDRMRRAGL